MRKWQNYWMLAHHISAVMEPRNELFFYIEIGIE